jgi:7-cyano-7-deazaguanine synthase in queuosine biosynthesis
MTSFELLPEGAAPTGAGAEVFSWPAAKGSTPSVITDVGAWLTSVGKLPPAAIDLVRIAAGAYMADRRSPRGAGFTRTMSLHVRLVRSEPWTDIVDEVADLLFWLTGDRWLIELSDDGLVVPATDVEHAQGADAVALLSGGLDSFCGAVLAGTERRVFLGHWDSSTVKGAQNSVKRWLETTFKSPVIYEQVRLVQATQKRESSGRSRSFLFLALAVAVAEARGAGTVEVPENGYTSLNPPLGPERGGALSTRSTHPYTITSFNRILSDLELAVRINDPYAGLTKGQLVAQAAKVDLSGFGTGLASTLSCGKLDGARYKGGNANHHCGLCVPCIVRRGAIAAADVVDATPYLSETLTGDSLSKLRRNRRGDVSAVRRALIGGFSDEMLLAMGPFPPGYDLDAAAELCALGLAELGQVNLD